jgi:hypothetical protein
VHACLLHDVAQLTLVCEKCPHFENAPNRESHADAINITDFGEIDPERFLEKFRRVFEKTGFMEHYNNMMGVEDGEK